MTTKNTPSGRVLEAYRKEAAGAEAQLERGLFPEWLDLEIRTALLRSHAIESGEAKLEHQGSDRPQGEIEAWNKAIDSLKGIGHDENR